MRRFSQVLTSFQQRKNLRIQGNETQVKQQRLLKKQSLKFYYLGNSFWSSCKQIVLSMSHSCRITGVGRGDTLVQSPFSSRISLSTLPQTTSSQVLSYLPGWKLHNLPGQHVPVSEHFHGKKTFSFFRCNFLYFHLFPLSFNITNSETDDH